MVKTFEGNFIGSVPRSYYDNYDPLGHLFRLSNLGGDTISMISKYF